MGMGDGKKSNSKTDTPSSSVDILSSSMATIVVALNMIIRLNAMHTLHIILDPQ